MTTIAYIRCSTLKQDEASQRQIVNSAADHLAPRPIEWLSDTASGGTPWQSRALGPALDRLAPGDTIVVSEISRIARSTVGVLTFLQAAAARGITVYAIKSAIRLDGSTASKIVVTVLAMAAEIERDLLRERTRAAIQARKARGLPIGRQTGATGKHNKLNGRAQEIIPLLTAGVSRAAISRILKVSRTTLHTYLNEGFKTETAATAQAKDIKKQKEV